MDKTESVPCTIFEHVLWTLQGSDGAWQRGEIVLGECLLLFTSLDAIQAFLDCCGPSETPDARPVVFSRNRKQFGQAARQAARLGIVGALIDPHPDRGEAPFLRFSRTARARERERQNRKPDGL